MKNGFTLIEAVIALLILAVVAAGLGQAIFTMTQSATAIENRSFATLVANNLITEIQTAHTTPMPGNYVKEFEMANRRWRVSYLIKTTEMNKIRSLSVYVEEAGAENPTLASEENATLQAYLRVK